MSDKEYKSDFSVDKSELETPVEKSTPVAKEHTVEKGETLSHLALKYYGHATKPYYMLIYEANKDLIGDDPNLIRTGMTLKIPALPEGM